MTTFKSRPDYRKVYATANEYLATAKSIEMFPFEVKPFLEEQSDIKICSFKKAREKYKVPIEEFGSESAFISEDFGRTIIFYNQEEPKYRVRFSILHEFAHYIFGHKTNFKENAQKYQIQELEANYFAAQMLMPEQILLECVYRREINLTPQFIVQAFGVSYEAASIRIKTLSKIQSKWRSKEEKEFDDVIVAKYATIVDQIAPKIFNRYDFEYEYEHQCERDSWFTVR